MSSPRIGGAYAPDTTGWFADAGGHIVSEAERRWIGSSAARRCAAATNGNIAVLDPSCTPNRISEGILNRVRVFDYGVMPRESKLLRPIASVGGPHQLHWRAAEAFDALAKAVNVALKIELKAVSAWRVHRWRSRSDYEAYVRRNYPSLAEGRKWVAFDSPHETGLAVDIGVGGLWPTRNTVDAQRRRPLHKWLVRHAAAYGWMPYTAEPWHWEFPIDTAEYRAEAGAGLQTFGAEECDSCTTDDDVVEADDIVESDCICEDMDMFDEPGKP